MVRHAFEVLTEGKIATRLIAFSDDMDGLRKVPDNIPNKELIAAHLGKPLTKVPDPFGTHDSFGAHNNARLRAFLDAFGFDYEFASATDYYKSGRFDAALKHMLARYDAVMQIMLPSFREERAATYSPFLPIHPKTGVVMQVATLFGLAWFVSQTRSIVDVIDDAEREYASQWRSGSSDRLMAQALATRKDGPSTPEPYGWNEPHEDRLANPRHPRSGNDIAQHS